MPKYISREGKDLLNQLLSKRPEKRITIEKCKTHDFFKGLDWEKLYKKEIVPPIILSGDDESTPENNEEYMFLKQQESKFKDRDYTEEN